jgi:hypothetical protein
MDKLLRLHLYRHSLVYNLCVSHMQQPFTSAEVLGLFELWNGFCGSCMTGLQPLHSNKRSDLTQVSCKQLTAFVKTG